MSTPCGRFLTSTQKPSAFSRQYMRIDTIKKYLVMTREQYNMLPSDNPLVNNARNPGLMSDASGQITSTAQSLLGVLGSMGSTVNTFNSTDGNPISNDAETAQRKARGRSVGNLIAAAGSAVASLLATFASGGAAAPLAVGAGSALVKGITDFTTRR